MFVAAASGTHATYDVCIRLVPGDAVGPRPVPRHRIRLVGGETRRGPSDHQPPAEMCRSIHESYHVRMCSEYGKRWHLMKI